MGNYFGRPQTSNWYILPYEDIYVNLLALYIPLCFNVFITSSSNSVVVVVSSSSSSSSSSIIINVIINVIVILLLCDIKQNPGSATLKSLAMCYANIRDLSDVKLGALRTSCFLKYCAVIILSETFESLNWTTDLSISVCYIVRKDMDSLRGGVAMYIKDNIIYKRHCNYECSVLENMWIELTTYEGNLFIVLSINHLTFLTFEIRCLDAAIERVKTETNGGKIVIIGDMNTPHGHRLLNLRNLLNFTYHTDEPTRITSHSKACLDQILSNIQTNVATLLMTLLM